MSRWSPLTNVWHLSKRDWKVFLKIIFTKKRRGVLNHSWPQLTVEPSIIASIIAIRRIFLLDLDVLFFLCLLLEFKHLRPTFWKVISNSELWKCILLVRTPPNAEYEKVYFSWHYILPWKNSWMQENGLFFLQNIWIFENLRCFNNFSVFYENYKWKSLLSFWLKIDESLKIKIKCSQKLSMSCCCPTQGQFKTCFGIFITLHFFYL